MSLIELMVALAVLAILVTVAAPSMQQLIDRQRASSSANEILSGLALARTEAIRRNATIGFCLDNTTRRWELRAGGTTNGTPNTTVLRQGDLTLSATLASENIPAIGGLSCVDYRSDGLPYAGVDLVTEGCLSVTLGTATRNVQVKTGSIYVLGGECDD